MGTEFHFIGAGDFGNKVAVELSKIYDGMRDGLFYEEHDEPHNHLHIHSFPFAETPCFDGKDHSIILVGSVHNPCWQEARKMLYDNGSSFMLTIGIDHEQAIGHDTFPPFSDESLVLPDPSLFDPAEVAQLVLQIFFIHTPWNMSGKGSLIGYDPADTMQMFAGKVTKVRKMTSDKEHYRQNFTKFLGENKADLSRAQGILISFWGRDDVLSIPKANELWEETEHLLMPDADKAFTFHSLQENGVDFITNMFLAL